MPLRPHVLLVAALLFAAPAAFADTFQWNYAGGDFLTANIVSSNEPQVYTTLDGISGYVILPDSFTQTFTYTYDSTDSTIQGVPAFSFTDGVQTFTNATPGLSAYFDIQDDSGALREFDVFLSLGSGTVSSPYYQIWINGEEGEGIYDECNDGCDQYAWAYTPYGYISSVSDLPANTPEPSSLLLAATGLFGLAAALRRRIAKPSLALLALAAAFSAPSARADTFTYTYTGNDFTGFSTQGGETQQFNGADSVTGTLVFAAPLTADMSLTSVTPLSFSFTDQVQTFTSSEPLSYTLEVGTDGSGQIDNWNIYLQTGAGTTLSPYNILISNPTAGDIVHYDEVSGVQDDEAVSPNPGSWSVTPEPSSLALLSTGLLGAACLARRSPKTVLFPR
jgi:hypothetical protein